MSDMTYNTKHSRFAMIVMFVLSVAALIGAISLFTKAYNQVSETEPKSALTKPENAGEKAQSAASMSSAFSQATGNPWFWFCLLNFIVLLGLGLFYLARLSSAEARSQSSQQDKQWGKLGFFAMFSLVGFLTVICLAIPYTWMRSGELLNRQGWSTMQPWLIVLAYVVGLGSMFASLLAIKSEERSSAGLRRWIYGYNAFLGALLFLAILGVVNAWFALYGPEPSDWTSENIYSLSPATKKLVKSIEKPVRVYVILRPDTLLEQDVLGTLNNCKALNSQLEIVELPLVRSNVKQLDELIKKYEVLRDATGFAQGLLLVQDPSSNTPLSTFISEEDLEEVTGGMRGMGPGQRFYKGEQAIYSALRDFRQEKKKVTIYFTQDSGELSIDENAARNQREALASRSIVALKQRIEKAGYVVKPLNLGQLESDGKTLSAIPEDALMVIVADPLRMTPEKASVLENYLKRPKKDGVDSGKLIVLLNTHFGQDGKVVPTGLEGILNTYGVQVGQDVVFTISEQNPMHVPVAPASMVSNLPTDAEISQSIEGIFRNATSNLDFKEARSVKPVSASVGFDTKSLLFAVAQPIQTPSGTRMFVWTENQKIPQPKDYLKKLIESKDILKKIDSPIPPTVAVTVRDQGAQLPPQQPGMPPMPGKPGAPRMVVFGDATFITDAELRTSGEMGANLMLSCLAWGRGKAELDSGDVKPIERKSYRLRMSSETLTRVVWLPLIWLLLGVILLGVGVAILRRR